MWFVVLSRDRGCHHTRVAPPRTSNTWQLFYWEQRNENNKENTHVTGIKVRGILPPGGRMDVTENRTLYKVMKSFHWFISIIRQLCVNVVT